MCEKQNDKWGQDVKLQLAGIPNNIVASGGRFHKDCKRDFFLSLDKNGKNKSKKYNSFINLVTTIRSDRTRIWNAIELYNLYNPKNKAASSSRKDSLTLIKHLLDYFNGASVSFHN